MSKASTMVSGLRAFEDGVGMCTLGPNDSVGRGVEQHRHLGGRGDLAGRDQRELVQQALRILDDTHHTPGCPTLVPDVPNLEVEGGGQTIGHRHLTRAGGVAPGNQRQHRRSVRPTGTLRSELIGVNRAGDSQGLVLNDVDVAEAVL